MNRQFQRDLLVNPVANRKEIQRAMGLAVRDALCDHKRAGNPVAVWQGGRVVWIAPEDIVIPPDPEEKPSD